MHAMTLKYLWKANTKSSSTLKKKTLINNLINAFFYCKILEREIRIMLIAMECLSLWPEKPIL